jgi:hypothetical protein
MLANTHSWRLIAVTNMAALQQHGMAATRQT